MMKKVLAFCSKCYFGLPAILLLAVIICGFTANCFISNTFMLDNRPLAEKPVKLSSQFSKEYEDYFNDTFAGRKKLVKKYSKIKMKLGFDNGYIINGQNGWMFYDSAKVPDGYTLVDYYGEVQYTPDELREITDGMKLAQDFYAKRGIDYVIAVVPNKEGLYSEYMPERMQKARISDISRTDRAIAYAQQAKINIINWRESLLQTKAKIPYPVYYQRDSHWNNIGAYVAYKQLADVLKNMGYALNVPEFDEKMITDSYKVSSDLSVAENADIDYKVLYEPEQQPHNLVNEDYGFFQIWENPQAKIKKRILLIRDSQGIALMNYLKKDFVFGVYAHSKWNTGDGLRQLIKEYKPDLVIDETGERYFNRFFKYKDIYSSANAD